MGFLAEILTIRNICEIGLPVLWENCQDIFRKNRFGEKLHSQQFEPLM